MWKKATEKQTLCGPQGCKNRACSVFWPKVIKGIPNQDVACFLARAVFSHLWFVLLVYVVFYFIVFDNPYQCNRLPGKTSPK